MSEDNGLVQGFDGKLRCFWAGSNEDYIAYHDHEWGYPMHDDIRLFEKICLEGFQAGLSWYTILKKRENFRRAFDGFDFNIIANYDDKKVEALLSDSGIVRHRGKINSVINNAKCALKIVEEKGSLDSYFWSFKPPKSELFATYDLATLKANPISEASKRLSKDLKNRGFSFVGPTTIYAFMQAMGMINDHIDGCFCRPILAKMQSQ